MLGYAVLFTMQSAGLAAPPKDEPVASAAETRLAPMANKVAVPSDQADPQLATYKPKHYLQFGPKLLLYRYVYCLSHQEPEVLRRLLVSPEPSSASFDMTNQQCEKYAFSEATGVKIMNLETLKPVIRGFAAEMLIERSAAVRGFAQSDAGVLPLRPDWIANTGRHPVVDSGAACAAEMQPDAVRTLLGTGLDTKAETDAFAALSPVLSGCMAAGDRVESDRTSLRAALAEALYHRISDQSSDVRLEHGDAQ